jgi:hypothetical protein
VSPTSLSLRHLRDEGWTAEVVERWVPSRGPAGGIHRDLFGMLDIVGIRGPETLGVQTTSAANVSHRWKKMLDDDHAPVLDALMIAGWRIVIHGWRLSTRDGRHACPHERSRCGCRWALHRHIDLTEQQIAAQAHEEEIEIWNRRSSS